jgi:hypothetical protein
MGRRQLWFAYGELELLRGMCVNLARLNHNISDGEAGDEPYFKVEGVLPVEQLAPLQTTYCPMEYEAMRRAANVIFDFYRKIAPPLVERYGLSYQPDLEAMMGGLLDSLDEPVQDQSD